MSTLKDLEGEDSYEAARRFRERHPQGIRSGRVGGDARNAQRSAEPPSELERAGERGPARTPQEDRLLRDTRDK
jgi:hypothetical protein